MHPFVIKSYKMITKLAELHNTGIVDPDHGSIFYIQSKHIREEFLQNLEVYHPKVDDPTRSVAEYYDLWWCNVSQFLGVLYSALPEQYLEVHHHQVCFITPTPV
jgi:hypothetical protein